MGVRSSRYGPIACKPIGKPSRERPTGNAVAVSREQVAEVAQVSCTVPEYLADLERQNPVAEPPPEPPPASGIMSATDPDATWAVKWGRAGFAYYDNYMIDNASRVIVDVAATPARFRHESLAARRMLERIGRLGLHPESLGADKAYGSGEFVAWLFGQGIAPHIPLIDRRHQTGTRFTRDQFRYAPEEHAYYCPQGQPLRYRRAHPTAQGDIYSTTPAQCRGCPQKQRCTPGSCADCSCTRRSRRARPCAPSLARRPARARSENAIRSRPCLPSSSSGSDWAGSGCDGSGTRRSSFTWRPPRRI